MRLRRAGTVAALLVLAGCAGRHAPPATTAATAPATASATNSAGPPPVAAPLAAGAIDLALARRYLAELTEVSAADGGKLWGRAVAGPTLLIDPETRLVVSNEGDAAGLLRSRDGLFVGSWPKEEGIANTSVEWHGKRWTMIMWEALGEDRLKRVSLMAHESFHRMQPDLGLVPDDAGLSAHLDTAEGRLWLQLEWRALEAALEASGAARHEALADALTFRAKRRALFPKAAAREGALEIMEGLAEYTGARIAGGSSGDVVKAGRERRTRDDGFVRSFAYVSGPLYGFALDASSDGWQRRVTRTTDLGALLGELGHVAPEPLARAESRATRYDGAALRATEAERGKKRALQIAAWQEALVDGPVLVIDRKTVTSASFDPRKVFPISDTQAVFVSSIVIGAWGTLTVEDGCALLRDDPSGESRVSLAGANADGTKGNGWSLELAKGWSLGPGRRHGDKALLPP